jgi:hypothetical protein
MSPATKTWIGDTEHCRHLSQVSTAVYYFGYVLLPICVGYPSHSFNVPSSTLAHRWATPLIPLPLFIIGPICLWTCSILFMCHRLRNSHGIHRSTDFTYICTSLILRFISFFLSFVSLVVTTYPSPTCCPGFSPQPFSLIANLYPSLPYASAYCRRTFL